MKKYKSIESFVRCLGRGYYLYPVIGKSVFSSFEALPGGMFRALFTSRWRGGGRNFHTLPLSLPELGRFFRKYVHEKPLPLYSMLHDAIPSWHGDQDCGGLFAPLPEGLWGCFGTNSFHYVPYGPETVTYIESVYSKLMKEASHG